MTKLIGIDFGTSSTQVTYSDLAGNPTLLQVGPDDNPFNIPSVVEVTSSGAKRFGFEVSATSGKNVVSSIKSRVPQISQLDEPEEAEGFALIRDFLAYVGDLTTQADATLSPSNSDVEVQMSCPTSWKLADRMLLISAAEHAGFTVKDRELIDEPISATVAWLAEREDFPQTGKALIFDMGAGTLDLAVVEIDEGGHSTIIGAKGTFEAGDSFDNALFEALEPRLKEKLEVAFSLEDSRAEIVQSIRVAKEELSNNNAESTFVTVLNMRDAAGTILKAPLYRSDFDLALETSVNGNATIKLSSTEAISYVLRHAKMYDSANSEFTVSELSQLAFEDLASEIVHVVLVGGMTKLPAVRNFLETLFPNAQIEYATKDPRTGEEAPRLTVALGLAQITDPVSLNAFRPNFSIKLFWEKAPQGLTVYEAYSDVFDLAKEKLLSNRSFAMAPWFANSIEQPQNLPTSPTAHKGGIIAFVKPNGDLIHVQIDGDDPMGGLFFAFGQFCSPDLGTQGARIRFTSRGELQIFDGSGRTTNLRVSDWTIGKQNGRHVMPIECESEPDYIPDDLEDWWEDLWGIQEMQLSENAAELATTTAKSLEYSDTTEVPEQVPAQPTPDQPGPSFPPSRNEEDTKPVFKPARAGAVWSLEDDIELISGYKNGLDYESVASSLSRTTSATIARLVVLCAENSNVKLPYNFKVGETNFTPNQELMLQTSLQAGVPIDIAASALTCPIEDVFSYGIENRLLEPIDPHEIVRTTSSHEAPSRRGAPWTSQEVEQLKIEISLGMTLADTANAHDRTRMGILMKTHQLGGLNDGQLEKLFGEAYFE